VSQTSAWGTPAQAAIICHQPLSPTEGPRHVELLAMVADLHADACYRIEVGSAVNIGRPRMDGSGADHLLVSLPHPYSPALERCGLGERHVRFLWLVPITAAEAGLVRSRGMDALENILDERNVDVVSLKRRSLV
jgi:hypothetical protein